MTESNVLKRGLGRAALAAATLACAAAMLLAWTPSQAWAVSVSTADDFLAKAADPTVSSIELEANVNLGNEIVDLSGKTVDLRGHTVTTKMNATVSNGLSLVLQGNDFSVKNGTFVSENRADYPLFIGDGPTSNVVLEGITVDGGINVYNSRNVVLRDVVANAEGSYYAVWCDQGAFVTVESGSYSSKGAGVVGITASAPSDLTVNGGEFVTAGENTPLVLPGYRDPRINGGTFDTPEVVNYIDEGFAPLFDGERYSVMDEDEAAAQGSAVKDGIYYVSPDDAENAPDLPGQLAVVKHKVTFEGEGVESSFSFVEEGSLVSAPVDPARDFYVFKGWYNGGTLWDFASDKVDGSLTLTAHWEGVSFKVTFVDGVESTEDLVETVQGGTAVAKPVDPVRDGFTFEGWFVDEACTEAYDFSAGVTRDTTLYAKWAQAPVFDAGTAGSSSDGASPLAKTGDAGMTIVLALGFAVVSAATVGFFARRRVR